NPPPLLLGDKPQGQFTQLGEGQNHPTNVPSAVNFGEANEGPLVIVLQGGKGQEQPNQLGFGGQNQGGQQQGNIGNKTEIKELVNALIGMLQKFFGGENGNGGNKLGQGENGNGGNKLGQGENGNGGEVIQKNDGGWLVKHGEYKKSIDGSFSINKGEWAGHTAKPNGQKGGFDIVNDKSGETKMNYQAPGGKDKIASPLTFDLNGNGKVDTTDNTKNYDINGDGTIDNTAWAGKGDGVLAFDTDGNGISGENGRELFGNNADINGDGNIDGHKNGFDALRAAALEKLPPENVARIAETGKLNEEDLSILEHPTSQGGMGLTMMVDGQQKKPSDLGMTEINLDYEQAGRNADENGNEHRQIGAGFTINGESRAVNDVWFQYN
ncbi:hypothetical protein BCV21_024500, partial [Vibrio lentus]|nr:hypothetical protein [Vibrio lentus]